MGIIERTKRKLWTFGFKVKDVSDMKSLGFDLVVESHYKVKVIKLGEDYDWVQKGVTVAIVSKTEITYHVCQQGKCWVESSPIRAFPKFNK